MKPWLRRGAVALGVGLWLAASAAALTVLARYRYNAGQQGIAPEALPAEWHIPKEQPTLVVALHPRCPCSRATLAELAKLLARHPDSCRLVALVYKPTAEPASWIESGLVGKVRQLSAEVHMDDDGRLARHLGLLTSGQVLFYDTAGELRFEGGVTAGRGHEGDNAGESVVERLLNGEVLAPTHLPAFGCSLGAE